MKIFDNIPGLPVGNDLIEQKNEFCSAVVSMILGLDLIKDNCVMRESPVDLRSFKKLIENGVDGILTAEAVRDEFIFEPSNFIDEFEDLLLALAFGFSFCLHIFIIESIIQVHSFLDEFIYHFYFYSSYHFEASV